MKKRSNAIDNEQSPQGGGDMQFRRWEYRGFSGLFILHYTGDHTVFSGFAHRNSRKISRPFHLHLSPFYFTSFLWLYMHTSYHMHIFVMYKMVITCL